MSTFVFFVQLDPDIDHITPIAYRLNREKPGSVALICVNPFFEIATDYRLAFLRKEGVRVIYLAELGGPKSWKFSLARAVTHLPKLLLQLVPQRVWNYVYFDLDFVSPEQLRQFFEREKTKVVTIDDGHPTPRAQALMRAAYDLKLKTVRLSPGNHVRSHVNPPHKGQEGLQFDYQLRPHLLSPDGRLSGPETEEKVLGCMRYCEEWEKINDRLLSEVAEKKNPPFQRDRLNVLIFERAIQGLSSDHPAAKKVASLPFTDVVIRGRPRMLRPRKLFEDTLDGLPSALLIQWADVVVCSVTSVALDALYYEKPLLYLKFIAPDQFTTYEDFSTCWKLNSEEEFLAAVQKLSKQLSERPYTASDVKKYFTQTVYRGEENYDVLGGYARFYLSLIQ